MERYIAIDNVCAWPNLTKMPDGAIIAAIFNQPCHGLWEGDVECWASEDGGRTWRRRGTPAPHEPGTNRMNVAAGLADNGRSWGEPIRIVELQPGDLGYPATVPGEGGTLVTAWYCAGVTAHQRYHMGAAVWTLPAK